MNEDNAQQNQENTLVPVSTTDSGRGVDSVFSDSRGENSGDSSQVAENSDSRETTPEQIEQAKIGFAKNYQKGGKYNP